MRRRKPPAQDSRALWIIVACVVGVVSVAGGLALYHRLRPRTLEEQVQDAFVDVMRAPPAPPPPAPQPTQRESYIAARVREDVAQRLAGLGSSDVDDEALGRVKADAKASAEREWSAREDLAAAAEELARAQPARAASFRAAVDRVWPVARDLATAGEPLPRDRMRALLEQAADQADLQRR